MARASRICSIGCDGFLARSSMRSQRGFQQGKCAGSHDAIAARMGGPIAARRGALVPKRNMIMIHPRIRVPLDKLLPNS